MHDVNARTSFDAQLSSEFDDVQVLGTNHYEDFNWRTPLYMGSSLWALLSMKGAISDVHMDAGGYGTFVETIAGSKIWIIGSDPSDGAPTRSGHDCKKMVWYALHVRKGDHL